MINNFNLRILRAQLDKALENRLIYTALANNSFSGEINQKGDKVKINQIGDITINDYDGTDITSQALTDAQREITADQDKYFSFDLDEIDYNNASGAIMTEAMRKAAYATNSNIDLKFASLYADPLACLVQ